MPEDAPVQKNPNAQALARLGRGKPKKLSEQERELRRERMRRLNDARGKLTQSDLREAANAE